MHNGDPPELLASAGAGAASPAAAHPGVLDGRPRQRLRQDGARTWLLPAAALCLAIHRRRGRDHRRSGRRGTALTEYFFAKHIFLKDYCPNYLINCLFLS